MFDVTLQTVTCWFVGGEHVLGPGAEWRTHWQITGQVSTGHLGSVTLVLFLYIGLMLSEELLLWVEFKISYNNNNKKKKKIYNTHIVKH